MDKQRCYCGTHYINPDTAMYSVGTDVLCNRVCYTKALQALQTHEIEPQSVSGSMNGYSFTHKGWDVT